MSESKCVCGQAMSSHANYCSNCGNVIPSRNYVGCHMCSGKGWEFTGSQQLSPGSYEPAKVKCIYCNGTGRVAI